MSVCVPEIGYDAFLKQRQLAYNREWYKRNKTDICKQLALQRLRRGKVPTLTSVKKLAITPKELFDCVLTLSADPLCTEQSLDKAKELLCRSIVQGESSDELGSSDDDN